MKDYKALHDTKAVELICLKYTKHISDDDRLVSEWRDLAAQYPKADSNILRAIYSLINSIMLQQRAVFVLTRKNLAELISSDKNHIRGGLRNEDYRVVLGRACDMGIFKPLVANNKIGRPSAYEVVDEDLLRFLKVNIDVQREQTIRFCTGTKRNS